MHPSLSPTLATPLSAEEAFLWQCALTWRQPLPPAGTLAWPRLVAIAKANKMQTLLAGVLAQTGAPALPPPAQAALDEGLALFAGRAARQSRSLPLFLRHAAAASLPCVVMKGLALSLTLYGQAAMRPGFDIDILVPRARVYEAIALLEEKMGFGRFWPGYMADSYYDRHHLHHERSNEARDTWYEIHWALDHPLTLLTIDYEAMLARATPGQLLGAPVYDFSPPDLILSLSVHLVKHAVYLPALLDRPDLPRLILADGLMMVCLDVAEALKRYAAEMDWALLLRLARESGLVTGLGAVLRLCRHSFQAPVPAELLPELPLTPPGRLTRGLMRRLADATLAEHQGQKGSRFMRFLMRPEIGFTLRPIRLLDLFGYCFPPAGYLRRRYRSAAWPVRLGHTARALGQYARLLLDTLYYLAERAIRRRLARRTSR